jgi:hypothetical protein
MKTIKVVTDLNPVIQEVKVKRLFEYMGFKFAYVIKPYRYMNAESILELPAIVEISTGLQADSFVRSSTASPTIKGRIEDFKYFMDTQIKTAEVMQKELNKYNKINL